MAIELKEYTHELEQAWNKLVEESKNGTFLIDRRFMDYHSHRFTDCSVMFFNNGNAIGCFPANYESDSRTVHSHQGLTYGSLVTSKKATTAEVLHMFELLKQYYRDHGAKSIIYKPIPYIYHSYPAEEDRYALFRSDAARATCGVSTVVDLTQPIPLSTLRKRKAKKAEASGVTIAVASAQDTETYKAYWSILSDALMTRHNVRPVHSTEEMTLLARRFPDNIKLFVARNAQGQIVAGSWVFISKHVVHTQYLAANEYGREAGALDLTIRTIMEQYSGKKRYMDFGISTEDNGRTLNEGLIHQKEGFGGRAVCYESYRIDL